jgi:hypothetical protein
MLGWKSLVTVANALLIWMNRVNTDCSALLRGGPTFQSEFEKD